MNNRYVILTNSTSKACTMHDTHTSTDKGTYPTLKKAAARIDALVAEDAKPKLKLSPEAAAFVKLLDEYSVAAMESSYKYHICVGTRKAMTLSNKVHDLLREMLPGFANNHKRDVFHEAILDYRDTFDTRSRSSRTVRERVRARLLERLVKYFNKYSKAA